MLKVEQGDAGAGISGLFQVGTVWPCWQDTLLSPQTLLGFGGHSGDGYKPG